MATTAAQSAAVLGGPAGSQRCPVHVPLPVPGRDDGRDPDAVPVEEAEEVELPVQGVRWPAGTPYDEILATAASAEDGAASASGQTLEQCQPWPGTRVEHGANL